MRSIQFSHTVNTLSAYLDPNMSHVRHPWSTHLLFSLQGSLLYVHIYSFKRLFTNHMLIRPLKQVHCVCYPTFMEQLLCQRCSDAIDFLEEKKIEKNSINFKITNSCRYLNMEPSPTN